MKKALLLTAIISVAAFAEQSAVTIEGKSIGVSYAPAALNAKAFPGVAFHTDADLVFKGAAVPKGDYTLFVVPNGAAWQLVISKTRSGPRDPKLDAGRVPMTTAKATAPGAKVAVLKTAARAAKVEVTWDGMVGFAPFHLDRVAGDSEW